MPEAHFIPVDFNHDSLCGLTKRQWDYGVNVWEWVTCPACLEHRPVMTHIWFWRSRLPERKGQPCRVLVRGRMNSILVEFEDGYKVVTSRFAVRLKKQTQTTG